MTAPTTARCRTDALAVGAVINRHKAVPGALGPAVAKHFHLDIEDARFSFTRKVGEIAAETAIDGIYVVRTSCALRPATMRQPCATTICDSGQSPTAKVAAERIAAFYAIEAKAFFAPSGERLVHRAETAPCSSRSSTGRRVITRLSRHILAAQPRRLCVLVAQGRRIILSGPHVQIRRRHGCAWAKGVVRLQGSSLGQVVSGILGCPLADIGTAFGMAVILVPARVQNLGRGVRPNDRVGRACLPRLGLRFVFRQAARRWLARGGSGACPGGCMECA
jgi:hypothetical protein